VFVGRSLLPPGGGQNMLEPAALGRPVLTGPHTQNFRPEMSLLLGASAAAVVHSQRQLVRQLDLLLSDPREAERMGRAGRSVIEQGRGATDCTVRWIAPLLAGASAQTASAVT
jgi:3-deoxy-D-manno-octulosonic-acid transferase